MLQLLSILGGARLLVLAMFCYWPDWLRDSRIWPFLLGLAVTLMWGLAAVIRSVAHHRERMAKIEHGIDPDASGTSPRQ